MNKQTNLLINQFFTDLLGFEPELEIEQTDDEILVQLNVDTTKSGVIIGYRGEVLTSIQLILSLMTQTDTNSWYPVRLNINDYKQQRLAALENLAKNTANKVIETNSPTKLSNLSSYERRIVHSTLSAIPGITTHSEGDAPYRVLIVSPV